MNISTLIIVAIVLIALAFAVRYVAKNGSCGGCPGSKRCKAARTNGETASCSGHCASCHGCTSSTHIEPAESRH